MKERLFVGSTNKMICEINYFVHEDNNDNVFDNNNDADDEPVVFILITLIFSFFNFIL